MLLVLWFVFPGCPCQAFCLDHDHDTCEPPAKAQASWKSLDHSHEPHHHPPKDPSTLHEETQVRHWLKDLRNSDQEVAKDGPWLSSFWTPPFQQEPYLPSGKGGRSALRFCVRMLI